ncbi:MAG: radical SAM protein [Pseudomonadota bacterium]
MNVLLVSTCREREPEPVFPLGCTYLLAALKNAGQSVSFLDLMAEEAGEDDVKKKVSDARPGLVAVSIRNLENFNFPLNLSYVPNHVATIAAIRSATDAPIIVGGGGFAVAPEAFLAATGADAGVVGEGEEILPALATTVEKQGRLPDAMKNAVIRAPLIEDLDTVPPDRTTAVQDFYHRESGCATVQTKRGCNLHCTYCDYPLIEGARVRMRNVDLVAEEILRVQKDSGVDDFMLVDSIFNNPESHAVQFCEALIRKNVRIRWTGYFKPAFRDPAFFELLARSGCSGIDATPDSLSEKTLRSLGKDFDPGDVERFCARASKNDLAVNLNFIFGAPGEDEDTLKETFARIEAISPKSVICAIGIRLYPGAGLTKTLKEKQAAVLSEGGLYPTVYISEHVADTLVETVERVARGDSRWVVPGLGVRYNPRLVSRMRKHGKTGPIWKYL